MSRTRVLCEPLSKPTESEVDPAWHDTGVEARVAWGRWRDRPGGDAPELVSESLAGIVRPGRPAAFISPPPADVAFSSDGAADLVRDAAARALAMLAGEATSGLELDRPADLARRAAAALERGEIEDLADRTGRSADRLVRSAMAWRHGGAAGVAVLAERGWPAPQELIDDAAVALAEAGIGPERVERGIDRLTVDTTAQLRVDRARRWYLLHRRFDRWELVADPSDDAADLVAELHTGDPLDASSPD